MGTANDKALAALIDEQQIRNLMYRYCRAVDRRQFDDLRAVYHPEGTDHHGDFYGDADEFVAHVKKASLNFDRSMHFVGNLFIEIDGDKARSEAYVLAYVHYDANETKPARDNLVALRYVDDVTRVDGEWKILHRKCVYEWTRTDDVPPGWDFSEYFLRGTRDRDDTVYQPSLAGVPDVPDAPVTRPI